MAADTSSNFFVLLETLDEASRLEIEAACVKVTVKPRELVYEQGTRADAVYIVSSGTVDAVTFSADGKQSRTLAVMSRGDFFGDLAVLTGHSRLAAVQTREGAQVLRIEKDAFLNLMQKIPALGFFFARNLAHRLHHTATEAHHKVYSIDLTGNLHRFDLLTIVQAITGMGHTGELHLHNPANELVGCFFFRKGRVEHARFGHLHGLEAIWQGFIESASEGTFSFRSMEKPSLSTETDEKVDMESTSLLLEGVGKRDTYQALPEPLCQMQGQLTRITETLTWKADDTRKIAEQIWALISEKPQPLVNIWRKLNYSAITFLEVVMEMGMQGQVELFVDAAKIKE